jgi:hypothetical protein
MTIKEAFSAGNNHKILIVKCYNRLTHSMSDFPVSREGRLVDDDE